MKPQQRTSRERRALVKLVNAITSAPGRVPRLDLIEEALVEVSNVLGTDENFRKLSKKLTGVAAEILVDKAYRDNVVGVCLSVHDDMGHEDGLVVASVASGLSDAISDTLSANTTVDDDGLQDLTVH